MLISHCHKTRLGVPQPLFQCSANIDKTMCNKYIKHSRVHVGYPAGAASLVGLCGGSCPTGSLEYTDVPVGRHGRGRRFCQISCFLGRLLARVLLAMWGVWKQGCNNISFFCLPYQGHGLCPGSSPPRGVPLWVAPPWLSSPFP